VDAMAYRVIYSVGPFGRYCVYVVHLYPLVKDVHLQVHHVTVRNCTKQTCGFQYKKEGLEKGVAV